ncbi:sensor histidine kinase [Micromonospora sp. CPCC 206171]|uniref:sensor histidine kinase n=1 Tax=Micromonospora sp. CPCC 206171 TaxID=3122405 RepID=UPI002FF0B034
MAHRLTATTSLVLILLLGWAGWTRVSAPSDGSVVHLSNAVWQQEHIPISFVVCPCEGLHAGDAVVGITGPDLDGSYVYTVLGDDERRDVVVRLDSLSWTTLLGTAWSPLLTVILMLAVGWFVFAHRPRDPAARALLLVASLFGFGTTSWLLGETALQLATRGPRVIDVLGELALALVWGATGHFAVVMPGTTIRVPARRIAVLYLLPLLLHGLYLAVALPSSDGRLEALGRAAQVSLAPSLIMPIVTAGLMVLGYRRTEDPWARRRLRWVLFAFIFSAIAMLALWALPMLWRRPLLDVALLPTALLPSVVALAAAVLRYRLFDIEVIVRRSLLYGGLTTCVLTIYLSAGSTFGHLMGAGPGLAVVLATCLVAFSVQPLRDWLQSRIARLIYGERDNPFGLVSRLSRVDVAVEPQKALTEVAAALARALRMAYVGIELYTPNGRLAVVAAFGAPSRPSWVIPLRQGPTTVGRMLLDVGPGQEPFGPADRRLLDGMTRHIGNAAAVVLLNAELRESRHRLVLAREEERRRIAHALHDGLEAALAAHSRQLREARTFVETDPDRVIALLDAAISSTRTVIGDIRGLVSGMRPPALDQLGLIGAIRERVGRDRDETGAATAVVDVAAANDLGALPAAVEVAAFWITVEAARHTECAGAAPRCRARLERHGDLFVDIRADDRFRTGPGLQAAAERAEELGGTMIITATAVQARLPIRERTAGDDG